MGRPFRASGFPTSNPWAMPKAGMVRAFGPVSGRGFWISPADRWLGCAFWSAFFPVHSFSRLPVFLLPDSPPRHGGRGSTRAPINREPDFGSKPVMFPIEGGGVNPNKNQDGARVEASPPMETTAPTSNPWAMPKAGMVRAVGPGSGRGFGSHPLIGGSGARSGLRSFRHTRFLVFLLLESLPQSGGRGWNRAIRGSIPENSPGLQPGVVCHRSDQPREGRKKLTSLPGNEWGGGRNRGPIFGLLGWRLTLVLGSEVLRMSGWNCRGIRGCLSCRHEHGLGN